MHDNQAFGRAGEDYAAAFLIDMGWQILVRNYRCRVGEIDIIGLDSDAVVFCEVKTRSGHTYGGAISAVSQSKYRRLHRVAGYFCSAGLSQLLPAGVRSSTLSYRFDLVAIDFDRSGIPQIQHLKAI